MEEDADVGADVAKSPTAAAERWTGRLATHEALSSGGTLIRGLRVKLDLWRVLEWLVGPAHVANDGYGPWCLSLNKAFFIPNPELVAELKAVVKQRHPAWTEDQVERSLYGRYLSDHHRHVLTVVSPSPVLSERVDEVFKAFELVTDVKTGAVDSGDLCQGPTSQMLCVGLALFSFPHFVAIATVDM